MVLVILERVKMDDGSPFFKLKDRKRKVIEEKKKKIKLISTFYCTITLPVVHGWITQCNHMLLDFQT